MNSAFVSSSLLTPFSLRFSYPERGRIADGLMRRPTSRLEFADLQLVQEGAEQIL
jgi:hypothetical protein